MTQENNLLNRILSATVGATVLGKRVNTRISGNKLQVEAAAAAIAATRDLHETLTRPDATVEAITSALEAKHASALEFERQFGVKFPL